MGQVFKAAKVLTAVFGLGSACAMPSPAFAGHYALHRHFMTHAPAHYGMRHMYARHLARHAYARMGARYGYRHFGYARPFVPADIGYAHHFRPSYSLARSYQRPLYDGERHHYNQYRQDYEDNLGFGPTRMGYYGATGYGYAPSYSYAPSIFSNVTAGYNAGFDPGYGLCICR